jgi:hypothetical protein
MYSTRGYPVDAELARRLRATHVGWITRLRAMLRAR